MLWILVGLACNRVEPASSELRCDGLDDDQDGVVDEEVLAYRFQMPLDLGGAPELSRYFRFPLDPLPGVTLVEQTYTQPDGSYGTKARRFGTNGRLLYEFAEDFPIDGPATTALYEFEYEQGQVVYALEEFTQAGVLVEGTETIASLGSHGFIVEQVATDRMDPSKQTLTELYYDAQDRLVATEVQSDDDCVAEYRTYPDEWSERRAGNKLCGFSPEEGAARGALSYTWDSQRRLVSLVDYTSNIVTSQKWWWEDDTLLSRETDNGSSVAERRFDMVDGRVVSAVDEASDQEWTIAYNSAGVVEQVDLAYGEELVRLDMALREREGSDVIESFQVLLRDSDWMEGDVDLWWTTEMEVDMSGNLTSAQYSDGLIGEVDYTWNFDCEGAAQ